MSFSVFGVGNSPPGAAENLIINSENFFVAPWGNIAGGVGQGVGAADPFGGFSSRMTRLTGPDNGRNQPVTVALSTAYTISCHMRNVDTVESDLFIFNNVGQSVAELEILWSGAIPGTGGSANASNILYQNIGNDWYRISYTFISHASDPTARFTVKPAASSAINGMSLDYSGAMLEIGSSLSDYVSN